MQEITENHAISNLPYLKNVVDVKRPRLRKDAYTLRAGRNERLELFVLCTRFELAPSAVRSRSVVWIDAKY